MPGAASEPEAALSCPVMPACPSRGSEPVISVATSEKLAFMADEEIVVEAEKLLGTLMVPEPLRAKCNLLAGCNC